MVHVMIRGQSDVDEASIQAVHAAACAIATLDEPSGGQRRRMTVKELATNTDELSGEENPEAIVAFDLIAHLLVLPRPIAMSASAGHHA
ncbi:uncharacterized protein J7T54_002318 [Emericellopsis cladophorae]|uniref:Uncharacterized protein n=1 Tax=Emericellopsis cladophorae TaxID=2686198 RepID=A0A9P9Y1K7_9HYPO|nr:uncharacterized protein J7T54_002318 [Emericellopsis cladophorae]KAI6781425.1 hypothetical protein J7T54_002318 [Emericellopsis cladophorae]